ncbi:hypothetical protein BH10BAC5_BH10BAC5_11200 [soil metagenome]
MEFKLEKNFNEVTEFLHSSFSSPTHYPDWNLLAAKYFKSDFYYLNAYSGNELKGICPVFKSNVNRLNYLKTGIREFTIPYGGWILAEPFELSLSNLPVSMNEAFTGIALPSLPEFNVKYSDSINGTLETLVIDLSHSEDEIWNNVINSKRRNMIRKAEKSEVKITKSDSSDAFFDIYSSSHCNYGLPVHAKEFFCELFSTAVNIKFDIFYAEHEGIVSGALAMVSSKDYAIYWLGLTVKDSGNFGQGELLQWTAIKEAKLRGCKYYDLCYIEKDKLKHIADFKKAFGEKEISVPVLALKKNSFKILKKIVELPALRKP